MFRRGFACPIDVTTSVIMLYLATCRRAHLRNARSRLSARPANTDGVGGAVVVDERVDVLVAESALRSMCCGRWGSPAVASGWLLARRCRRGV